MENKINEEVVNGVTEVAEETLAETGKKSGVKKGIIIAFATLGAATAIAFTVKKVRKSRAAKKAKKAQVTTSEEVTVEAEEVKEN